MDPADEHLSKIFIAPAGATMTAAQNKRLVDQLKAAEEDGEAIVLSHGWGVYSGPPWVIHPAQEAPALPAMHQSQEQTAPAFGPWLQALFCTSAGVLLGLLARWPF